MTNREMAGLRAAPDHNDRNGPSTVRVYGWIEGMKSVPLVEQVFTANDAVELAHSILTAALQAKNANDRKGF